MLSIARAGPLDRRSDRPGTGDGTTLTAAHLARWLSSPRGVGVTKIGGFRARELSRPRKHVGLGYVVPFQLGLRDAVNPPPGGWLFLQPASLYFYWITRCTAFHAKINLSAWRWKPVPHCADTHPICSANPAAADKTRPGQLCLPQPRLCAAYAEECTGPRLPRQ
jgi:hypothetical protein